jgi:hypothetical protein
MTCRFPMSSQLIDLQEPKNGCCKRHANITNVKRESLGGVLDEHMRSADAGFHLKFRNVTYRERDRSLSRRVCHCVKVNPERHNADTSMFVRNPATLKSDIGDWSDRKGTYNAKPVRSKNIAMRGNVVNNKLRLPKVSIV